MHIQALTQTTTWTYLAESAFAFIPQPFEQKSLSVKEIPQAMLQQALKNFQKTNSNGIIIDREHAVAIKHRLEGNFIQVVDKTDKTVKNLPPLLYDLAAIQKEANKKFQFSAKKTLGILQVLYEKLKAISYPRTDSKHLPEAMQKDACAVALKIKAQYQGAHKRTGLTKLGKRYVDDSKVSDHHAIIPTGEPLKSNSKDLTLIYSLICRRFLCAWHDPQIIEESEYRGISESTIESPENSKLIAPKELPFLKEGKVTDKFKTKVRVLVQKGFTELYPSRKGEQTQDKLLDQFPDNQEITGLKIEKKETNAPEPMTDASLLSAMELAGRTGIEFDKDLRKIGLGTPATRAPIIETLLQREYLRRDGAYEEKPGTTIDAQAKDVESKYPNRF